MMLFEDFDSSKRVNEEDIYTSLVDGDIARNLNSRFELREYQLEAIGRLKFYTSNYRARIHPSHLLFHMATGSGKTLIMAANILQLYKQGYRNFIFFVNSTNIIEKTKDNFLNKSSSKYLFSSEIRFDENVVQISEVDNFDGVNSNDINIVFSTIQGLHIRLNNPRENSITFEDFENSETVLISDEAHHINALTKSKLNRGEQDEKKSWEGTVERIIRSSQKNILLEFTATIDLTNTAIRKKYNEKIIFQYDLKQFRLDKYSKEIEVLETDLEPIDRALQAVIVSQYRRKIAEKHGISLKPVILFKANYVNEPSRQNPNAIVSRKFKAEFIDKIKNLRATDIKKFNGSKSKILKKAFTYFDEHKISLENLAREIQNDFEESKCLSVDSNEEKFNSQILVNTLEAPDNEIRAVFAVEMLNEGWDVLNLFDIVRLYNTRDAKSNKPGPTTIAEAQLIGRGARYFPFKVEDGQSLYRRKFDDEKDNELRVLEQLYYHSAQNLRYIQELKMALTEIGILPEKYIDLQIHIKDEFKKTEFWKTGQVYANKRIQNPREAIRGLEDADIVTDHEYQLRTGEIREETLFEDALNHQEHLVRVSKRYKLIELGSHVVRAALDHLEFYRFGIMHHYFPYLGSRREFIESPKYLGGVNVAVYGPEKNVNELTQPLKLSIAISVLKKIAAEARSNTAETVGTKVFYGKKLSTLFADKIIRMAKDDDRAQGMVDLNLAAKYWFAQNDLYGTSEEREFVNFLDRMVSNLSNNYEEIALLRNERVLALYDFDEGRRFEPDFILMLKEKNKKDILIHQVFIEPKGNQFKDSQGGYENSKEGWKQKFLNEIENNATFDVLFENRKFRLLGLPFYNKDIEKVFEEAFSNEIVAD